MTVRTCIRCNKLKVVPHQMEATVCDECIDKEMNDELH